MERHKVERLVLLIAVTISASIAAVVVLNLVCLQEKENRNNAADFAGKTTSKSPDPEWSKYISRLSTDTPVLQAVIKNDFALVSKLIAQGADVNISDLSGCSPLHVAVGSENLDMVKLLLKAGADVDAGNHKGWTPLMAAFSTENWDMQKLLHINIYGNDGSLAPCRFSPSAPILKAINSSDLSFLNAMRDSGFSLIKELIAKGEDVNVCDLLHRTPLHAFVSIGNREIVELLLDTGAEVNVMNRKGITPLDRAANEEIEQLLKSHGAKTSKELLEEGK